MPRRAPTRDDHHAPADDERARRDREDLDHIRDRLAAVDDLLGLLVGFFAFSPVAFQVYRADGVCLLTNPAFRALFGSEPPPGYNVLRDEIAEQAGILGLIHRAFAGEVVRTPPVWYDARELRQVQVAEANRVAIEATFFPVFDRHARVGHVAIAFRDVTEEQTAREAAEASRARAEALAAERQTILAQLAEGVITTDAMGQIVFVNEAARRLHGVAELGVPVHGYSQAYGLFTLEGTPYPPEDLPLARAVLRGETVTDARWRIRRPDGTEVVAEGSAAPLLAPDGTRLGSALVLRDVSAQFALDEEKDAFLAGAAHDLKSPLAAVYTVAQLLARRVADGRVEPERINTGLSSVVAAARQMEALVDELLDLARVRLGRPPELSRAPVDLVDLARQAADRQRQATRQHQVTVEAAESALVGEWDPDRVARVLDNLLGNAGKYSADEGGHILVRVERARDEAGDWAVVSFQDDGVGIPAADLPHVFERFRRGSNVARRVSGSGLGLASARQIVELHGGSIQVDSVEGHGTTAMVRLPLGPPRTFPG